MKTVCPKDRCSGCMACLEVCPQNAISVETGIKSYNAVINELKCINCDRCHAICQNNNQPQFHDPVRWIQGWTKNPENRKNSASGGYAYEIEKAFLTNGGHVWSCVFADGDFKIQEAKSIEDLDDFRGSKYVKSNPAGIYNLIKKQLQTSKVLFVGLPCQVAAIKNFVGKKLEENLYTVDLICHGTPSPALLNRYLNQYGYALNTIKSISFRDKNQFRLKSEIHYLSVRGTCDSYTQAFLEGLTYTDNCYHCPYARKERISDLTAGDSWGTELSIEEQQKGVSLILMQTAKGEHLLNNLPLVQKDVDINKARAANHQLIEPNAIHPKREQFFNQLEKSSFNSAVRKCLPVKRFKQFVKTILIKSKLLRGGGYD